MKNKELLNALNELKGNFLKVAFIMGGETTEEQENAFSTSYPFDKDFLELSFDVSTWVENVEKSLKN